MRSEHTLPSLFTTQENRIFTVSLLDDVGGALFLTEAFVGFSKTNATLSIVTDGVPSLHVETIVNGQAAWEYDVFFVAPHLADVTQLSFLDEGNGE